MTQLNVLAHEVHERAVANYKVAERFLYAFIMDVKQIRDERLYKDLGITSFEAYCEQSWNVKRDYMDERIQIADSFGTSFDGTYRQLGHSKSLLLARMEPEIRKQIEETVNVDETAVRKLKEIEKALQESELRAEQSKQQMERYSKELRERPVIEKPTSMPQDKAHIQALEKRLENAEREAEVFRKKANLNEEEAKKFAEMKKQISFLNQEKSDLHRQIESATALSGLAVKIQNFLKTELAPIRYSRALERLDSEVAVRNLTEIILAVEHWCEDIRKHLPEQNRIIVEVSYDSAS